MEMFDVKQKEIDQVKKKEELKSTNPLKVNKRKRKQKDIIMKLIDNLPNHSKDKNEYLIKLKDSIDIPIACIKCRKYGHQVTKCAKGEKAKKGKDKTEKTKKFIEKTRWSRYKTSNSTRLNDGSKNSKTRN